MDQIEIEKEIKALQKKKEDIDKGEALNEIILILSKRNFVYRWTQVIAFIESLERKERE